MAPRVLPHNLDAEASILGGILLRNEILGLLDTLEIDSFYDNRHKVVFSAIRTLQAKSHPIDVVTLEAEIERQGKLEAIGGVAFLGELAMRVPTPDNVEAYAEIVNEKAVSRQVMLGLSELMEEGYDLSLEGDALVAALSGLALHIRTAKEVPIITMGEVIRREATALEIDLDRRARGEMAFAGVPTGIHMIDDVVGGWPRGLLSLVLARPAVGKTTYAMAMAENSNRFEETSLLASYEDLGRSFGQRGLAQGSGVSTEVIRARNIKQHHNAAISAGIGASSLRTELFLAAVGMSVEKLIARVRRENLKRRSVRLPPIRAVHIDYLQKMPLPTSKTFSTKDQQIGHISAALANWAAEDDIAVIAYCQLNREIEKRDDHRPRVSDIRDSGNLEQDGKFILGLMRPINHDPKADPFDLRALILKNHNGEQNLEIPLFIDLPTSKIFDSKFEYQNWRSARSSL